MPILRAPALPDGGTIGIQYSATRDFALESILALYTANQWSLAQKPQLFHKALTAHSTFPSHYENTAGPDRVAGKLLISKCTLDFRLAGAAALGFMLAKPHAP